VRPRKAGGGGREPFVRYQGSPAGARSSDTGNGVLVRRFQEGQYSRSGLACSPMGRVARYQDVRTHPGARRQGLVRPRWSPGRAVTPLDDWGQDAGDHRRSADSTRSAYTAPWDSVSIAQVQAALRRAPSSPSIREDHCSLQSCRKGHNCLRSAVSYQSFRRRRAGDRPRRPRLWKGPVCVRRTDAGSWTVRKGITRASHPSRSTAS